MIIGIGVAVTLWLTPTLLLAIHFRHARERYTMIIAIVTVALWLTPALLVAIHLRRAHD